jgi:dienelactone hydrolase
MSVLLRLRSLSFSLRFPVISAVSPRLLLSQEQLIFASRITMLALTILVTCFVATCDALPPRRNGEVEFKPAEGEERLPERFQLPARRFAFEQQFVETVSKQMEMSLVTFPSPVVTPHENNNTVHCEYYRPLIAGKRPAVIVLHILGGDFDLARLFARHLAYNGTSTLFLKMPYYGPRRQPEVRARMISEDPRETVAGMTQAVLDIRCAAAWLASQEEVDPNRLGIFGISLGGITSALAATVEPRLTNVCLMLAGGDVGQVAWSSRELTPLRRRWEQAGGTKESFMEVLNQVDPVTYAANLRGRRVLMLNATRDEVIPKACTESLWRAIGEPKIVWLDGGHYSAVLHIFDGLGMVASFFRESGKATN